MQYKPELHSERWVEEHFTGDMYKKPLCFMDLWLNGFVSFWYMQITPPQSWSLTHLALSGQLTALVWPNISFYYNSSLWDLSWILLLLGELRPVLGPSLRELTYIKQRGWLEEEKKMQVVVISVKPFWIFWWSWRQEQFTF